MHSTTSTLLLLCSLFFLLLALPATCAPSSFPNTAKEVPGPAPGPDPAALARRHGHGHGHPRPGPHVGSALAPGPAPGPDPAAPAPRPNHAPRFVPPMDPALASGTSPSTLTPTGPIIGPWLGRGWPNWLAGAGNQRTFDSAAFARSCLAGYNSSSIESAPYGLVGVCYRAGAVHQAPQRPVNVNMTVATNGNGQFDCTAILVLPRQGQDNHCDHRAFDAIYEHYVAVGKGTAIGGGSWNIDQTKFPGPHGDARVEDALLDTRHPGYVLIPTMVLPASQRRHP